MEKIDSLYAVPDNASPVKKQTIDHDLLKAISLQDCRKVEEEFARELNILEKHLENPDFGVGPHTIGSELELSLVNKNSLLPSMVNVDICDSLKSHVYHPEISKFCIEYNGPVLNFDQQPFNSLSNELDLAITELNTIAENRFNTSVVPIGIMPSITTNDLGMDALTPYQRYHSIDKLLRLLRCNQDFVIDIDGQDPIQLKWYNTVLEGVNTSYQVHLRVNPKDFNDYYNAAQLAAPFILAVSGNSPLLFGHRLWEETRIAIFEQTVNNHNIHPGAWQEQKRVSFGRGWIHNGAIGLFKENCELYYPIFPIISEVEKKTSHDYGPNLQHVMQHNSSIWTWNRPVYDPVGGGHFRIEMRYLPAGPTVEDMVINTGFMLGLTKYFSKNIKDRIDNFPFKYAQYNFYQAAQHGLNADCIWAINQSESLQEVNIKSLILDFIEPAGEGLSELGATDLEIKSIQRGIQNRLEKNLTGSIWQKQIYNKLIEKDGLNSKIALMKMFKLYIENQKSNTPVADWSLKI